MCILYTYSPLCISYLNNISLRSLLFSRGWRIKIYISFHPGVAILANNASHSINFRHITMYRKIEIWPLFTFVLFCSWVWYCWLIINGNALNNCKKNINFWQSFLKTGIIRILKKLGLWGANNLISLVKNSDDGFFYLIISLTMIKVNAQERENGSSNNDLPNWIIVHLLKK